MPSFDYEVLLAGGERIRVTQPVAVDIIKHLEDVQHRPLTVRVAILDRDGTQKAACIAFHAIVGVLASEEALKAAHR